ncbi:hypothetical protein BY458DRAFT_530048 [Sporodiniella umbellata]|nr:hypothetical protein BY458DRAFT_530048 [Sporodiniella umbellata]
MPYICPRENEAQESIHEFSALIKHYQPWIEQDAVARCMVGFTAAQLIQNAHTPLSIESIESWLKSRFISDAIPAASVEENNSIETLIRILEDAEDPEHYF